MFLKYGQITILANFFVDIAKGVVVAVLLQGNAIQKPSDVWYNFFMLIAATGYLLIALQLKGASK